MVEDQPSVLGLQRRRAQADLARVPPGAVARLEQHGVVAPVAQVGRIRHPHVRAAAQRCGPVDHRPPPVESTREQRGVLVLRRHHRTRPARRSGSRWSSPGRPSARAGCRPYRRSPTARRSQPRQARVLAAPDLFGVVAIGREQRLVVERPVRDPIRAPRDVELRDPSHVLDANEEEATLPTWAAPALNTEFARTAHRPRSGSDCGRTLEELVRCLHRAADTASALVAARPPTRPWRRARIRSAAISHISVDSAPWFRFTPSGVRPSKPAPRSGSATARPGRSGQGTSRMPAP